MSCVAQRFAAVRESRCSQEIEEEIRPFLPFWANCIDLAPPEARSDLVAVAVREHGDWTAVIVRSQIAEQVLAAVSPPQSSSLRRLREPIAPGGLRVLTEVIDDDGRWVGVMRFLRMSNGGLA